MLVLGVSFPPPWAVFLGVFLPMLFIYFLKKAKELGTCPRGVKIGFYFLLVKQIFFFYKKQWKRIIYSYYCKEVSFNIH